MLKNASKFIGSILVSLLSFNFLAAEPLTAELDKLLSARLGKFKRVSAIRPPQALFNEGLLNQKIVKTGESGKDWVGGEVQYLGTSGRLLVELIQFRSDTAAYSLLTIIARATGEPGNGLALGSRFGTASATSQDKVLFFKGTVFVRLSAQGPVDSNELDEFAELFEQTLSAGEGEIPVLVKHLPDWENAQKHALYLSRFSSLQPIVPEQPVLAVLDTVADSQAVVADYGSSRLVIIEFNTPQLAGDIDRQVNAKIQELKSQNQPAPTSYRRVGNYSVFVFNAASDQAANQLIDQIKYEQVVQWLGENPYWLKEAERRYTETTLGVLIAVIKASGLTLITCFGLGFLIGAAVYARRRARQATTEAFSDAGGMLRLNLDEITPQSNPARLLTGRN